MIGYWREQGRPELPDPHDYVDEGWAEDDHGRRQLVEYLSTGGHPRVDWMGPSSCRLCGDPNGAGDVSDGVYGWPEGLAHYVDKHAVRLPPEFVTHVEERLAHRDDDDGAWWIRATWLQKNSLKERKGRGPGTR